MQRRWEASCPKSSAADHPLGNSVGAIGSVAWGLRASSAAPSRLGNASALLCLMVTINSTLPRGWVPLGSPWVPDSYLVDSASSHMLVSKIKPCMSKYKQLYRETANGSLNQLSFI